MIILCSVESQSIPEIEYFFIYFILLKTTKLKFNQYWSKIEEKWITLKCKKVVTCRRERVRKYLGEKQEKSGDVIKWMVPKSIFQVSNLSQGTWPLNRDLCMPFAKLWFDQRKDEDGSAKCIKAPCVEPIQHLNFNLGILGTVSPCIMDILLWKIHVCWNYREFLPNATFGSGKNLH